MHKLKYLAGYSATVTDQVHLLIQNDKLSTILLNKYPNPHEISTNKVLYSYVMEIKNQFIKKSNPLSKVV